MSKETRRQAKEHKAEYGAETKAAAQAKLDALASGGKKLDVNGREVISPKAAIAVADRAWAERDTPAKAAKRASDRELPHSTEIAGIYKSTLSGNADGTAQVRQKNVLNGRFTRQEVHVKDDKGDMRRVEKIEANALRTRTVNYAADGSKTASAAYKGGIKIDTHIDKDGHKDVMGVKVGKVFERRYGLDADGNKVLVASRNGLSSTNTIRDENGKSLTKEKQLGGLRSTTTMKDAQGNEEIVAKRRGSYRSNTYKNEDGTSTTIKGRKGLYTKTSEQSIKQNEDGSYKIVETTKTSRFGGLYKKTSAREVDLSDAQKTSLGAKRVADMEEAAIGSARALNKAVKSIREGAKDAPGAGELFQSVKDFAGKTEQYRNARIDNGDHNVAKTRTFMQRFAEVAEREDRLEGVDAKTAKAQLENRAQMYLYAKNGSKGEFASSEESLAAAKADFREAGLDFAHVMKRDGLATKGMKAGDFMKDAYRDVKERDELSLQNAWDHRAKQGLLQKVWEAEATSHTTAKESGHFKDFVNNIDLGRIHEIESRAAAKARAPVAPQSALTKENLAKLNVETGSAAQPQPAKAPSVHSSASDDSFFSAKSEPSQQPPQAERPGLAERSREMAPLGR